MLQHNADEALEMIIHQILLSLSTPLLQKKQPRTKENKIK